MICYKDRTFCSWSNVCANTSCPRWYNTEEVQKQDLPVALADFKTDTCGYIPHPIYAKLQSIVIGEQDNESEDY